MKLGIIGQGFVGTAVYEGMKHAFEIATYDKAKSNLTIAEGYKEVVASTDGPIFVCLPTPMQPDGSCNLEIVTEAVQALNIFAGQAYPLVKRVVVIKSTVVPGTTDALNQRCDNLHVCFNPEFLTERNAIGDFKNQDRIIIGGPRGGTGVLKSMYATAYPNVPVTKTSGTIAELVKYTTNCFLATKVAMANEVEQICGALGVDYDKIIEYSTKDGRLGQSHWAVPGPDGKKGYGGSCFPKDLNALITLAKSLDVKPTVMEAAWQKNLEVRPERDWEQLKGRAIS